ncbi:MAG: GH92 family glycosyl hydrolase [Paludibacter sp.]|nr:GH92 family glycosyl hydrolase [Paludibacter sp.]
MRNYKKILLLMLVICVEVSAQKTIINTKYTQYVNTFIGNADNGHTFPGACVPFGLIQVSPESGNGSWRYCSGFNYDDDQIVGFSQTHLNGTGVPDLGDIRMLPFNNKLPDETFSCRYNRKTQTAKPGYYFVNLSDLNINVELTATGHTAFHKYTYNQSEPALMLIDLQNGLVNSKKDLQYRMIDAKVEMPDNKTIIGYNRSRGWVNRNIYYVIKFDFPYKVKKTLTPLEGEKAKRLILEFELSGSKSVQAKVAISTVSIEGALKSIEKENPNWDFDSVRSAANKDWNDLLSTVDINGTNNQKINFYTSMYHLFIQPNNIADVDGKYRGANDSVFTSVTGNYYSTFSLWDTYRAAHPLYTILAPEKINDFVNSMIAHANTQGFLPIWTLWGKENYCMIGNHAVPVVVDAYLKGLTSIDGEKLFKAIKTSLTTNHQKSDWDVYDKFGYYPFDIIKNESVSRTLESGYDDYCARLMAQKLGKKEDYDFFMKRAGYYKNIFDNQSGMMRGKDSKGNWRTPFNSFSLSHDSSHGGDYTEGNAWQYTFHVQHDIEGLIRLMGGATNFKNKLDSLFYLQSSETKKVLDVTGLIGQYAHGNEPSHHIAYLYNFIGESYKTQELIREIFDRFYLPKPNGLCGNDDCGQMSAWYIFSAMGFYPVNPVGGEYILGAPQVDKVTISLPNNKVFIMTANNLNIKNKYVKSVSFNGKKITDFRIHYNDIMNGGNLVFEMTDTAN